MKDKINWIEVKHKLTIEVFYFIFGCIAIAIIAFTMTLITPESWWEWL